MIARRLVAVLLAAFATIFITGCAVRTGARALNVINSSSWQGRLSVRVEADERRADSRSQSLSAAFELQGNEQQGHLMLLTPLGSTAASVRWTALAATLQAQGEVHEFKDLNALITHLLGTPVPVNALFSWLDGQPVNADGWEVDLTNRQQGKISARRLSPLPVAELRLILEE
ncbi:MAG: outer membrane lipoprotein LolB [Comamonadaceae bacterium]|nr:outer membrane lipoprotein LolB [Comamonadaceae bacterium]